MMESTLVLSVSLVAAGLALAGLGVILAPKPVPVRAPRKTPPTQSSRR